MQRKNFWLILLLLICLPLQSMAAISLSCVHKQDSEHHDCQHEMDCCQQTQNDQADNDDSRGDHNTCATCLSCHLSGGYSLPVFNTLSLAPVVAVYAREGLTPLPDAIPTSLLRPPQHHLV
jgi:hypothetical protein